MIKRIFASVLVFALAINISYAQPRRTFGVGGLELDNGTAPLRTIDLFAPTSLAADYQLELPPSPPSAVTNYLMSDASGHMSWTTASVTLPSLPAGAIWVGNAFDQAQPYAPTIPGSIMTLNASNIPTWSTVVPINTTISVSQLTSGTIPPGVTVNVGTGSTIQSTGGTVTANNLIGAGIGKYSGSVPIPQNSITVIVSYPPIQAGSTVLLSIIDPSLPGVLPFLENITPGAGFKVTFSSSYPTTSGSLSYTVVVP